MKGMSEQWVVEWNWEHRSFEVHPVMEVLRENWGGMQEGERPKKSVQGLFPTMQGALEYAGKLRAAGKARGKGQGEGEGGGGVGKGV